MVEAVRILIDFPPDDVAISRLRALAFGDGEGRAEPWADRLRRHSVTWIGAFDTDKLVGFVHVVWDGGKHGFLLDTAIHPAYQRTGMGAVIVAAAAGQAAAAGCEWLHVDYGPPLAGFYEACGFGSTAAGLMRLTPAA